MNVDICKRQRRSLDVAIWFLSMPAFLSLSIVVWKHVRTVVTFSATLLIATLCHADTLADQSHRERVPEPHQVVSSWTYLLNPPSNDGGPTVVKVAFQLQKIDEIDDDRPQHPD